MNKGIIKIRLLYAHMIGSNVDWRNSKIWELKWLNGHSNWVYSVSISPDSKTMASGGGGGDGDGLKCEADNSLRLWILREDNK